MIAERRKNASYLYIPLEPVFQDRSVQSDNQRLLEERGDAFIQHHEQHDKGENFSDVSFHVSMVHSKKIDKPAVGG